MEKALPSQAAARAVPRGWWLFCLGILSLKLFLFALDPQVKFFMGDSMSYLWTAMVKWIPEDRSYLYGYVIGWLCLGAKSFTPLLLLQLSAAALTAINCAAICLLLKVPRRVAYFFGFICALDPLQLFWERAVMTETLSLFCYSVIVLYSLGYLIRRRISGLVVIQLFSVLAIGFRMSYLVTVQLMAALLPVIAFFPQQLPGNFRAKLQVLKEAYSGRRLAKFAAHLAVSVAVMFLFHDLYKRVNGYLSHREPDYLYGSGLFLLSFWAPVLQPQDATDPALARLIAQGDTLQLREIDARPAQRYSKDGLVARYLQVHPDMRSANAIGKATAFHALRRNPFALVWLTARTYFEFWMPDNMKRFAKLDTGAGYFTPTEGAEIARCFQHIVPAGDLYQVESHSLSGRYYISAWPYYFIVLVAPFLLGCIFVVARQAKAQIALLFVHGCILLTSTLLFSIFPIIRYLHPISFLTIITLALLAKWSLEHRRPTLTAATTP